MLFTFQLFKLHVQRGSYISKSGPDSILAYIRLRFNWRFSSVRTSFYRILRQSNFRQSYAFCGKKEATEVFLVVRLDREKICRKIEGACETRIRRDPNNGSCDVTQPGCRVINIRTTQKRETNA